MEPIRPAVRHRVMAIACSSSAFVSAFLLFLVQPMFTKMALPLLGGSPDVWNVSVVFYEVVVVAGYLYAHLVRTYLSFQQMVVAQAVLLALALAALPIRLPAWAPAAGGFASERWLIEALFVCVGMPFFVLSTTSPLIQAWFANTTHPDASEPYGLYVASNVGSLGALLVYPLVIEATLGMGRQTWLWTIGYVILVPLLLTAAVVGGTIARAPDDDRNVPPPALAPIATRTRLQWLGLACVPSSLMLGVTTHLTNIVGSIPLLWTGPLALYLLTFVIVFARRPVVSRAAVRRILPYVLLPLVFLLAVQRSLPPVFDVTLNLGAFFLLCLVCHGELSARRPNPRQLTEFYFIMAAGGALGGILNTFVAPFIFRNVTEYPLAIAAACLAIGHTAGSGSRRAQRLDAAWPLATLLALCGALAVAQSRMTPVGLELLDKLVFGVAVIVAFAAYERRLRFAAIVGAMFIAGGLFVHPFGIPIAGERNFFGVKSVIASSFGDFHLLIQSGTVHGIQDRDPGKADDLTAYYARSGPLGDVFSANGGRDAERSVYAIGLGAGTIACDGRRTDRWTFVEIDPQMAQIATRPADFSFLADCMPRADIVIGDGRFFLAHQAHGPRDLIVIDAYSGDDPPTHLLTREALALYVRSLAPHGVLVFNISNRIYDLRPEIGNLAADGHLVAYGKLDGKPSEESAKHDGIFSSSWVIAARAPADVAAIVARGGWHRLAPHPSLPLWTDDYSSLIRLAYWNRTRPAAR